MDLDSLLKEDTAPKKIALSQSDLQKFFYKYMGLKKDLERERAFWVSAKKNLERAYKEIREEIEHRKEIEEELRKKNKEFEKMNTFLVDRELKMVELKKELKRLSEA